MTASPDEAPSEAIRACICNPPPPYPSGVDVSTEDEKGYPPDFGPPKPTTNVDLLRMPPWDHHPVVVSDTSAACCLKNFIKRVLQKVESPLIHQPPKRPSTAKPMLPLQSQRLVAQSLSRVPAFRRGETLIMQHMDLILIYQRQPYWEGRPTTSSSRLGRTRLTSKHSVRSSRMKMGHAGSSEDARPLLRLHRCPYLGYLLFCVIPKLEYVCVRTV